MDESGKRDRKNRGVRPKKRKFCGNQFLSTGRKFKRYPVSSSRRKLSKLIDPSPSFTVNPQIGYEIINFVSVFSSIALLVKCKDCSGNVQFEKHNPLGLGFQIKVSCEQCVDRYIDSSSKTIVGKNNPLYEINTKLIFVLRCLGIGYSGLVKFCGLMDLPVPVVRRTYDSVVKRIRNVAKSVAGASMKAAVTEEISKSENENSLIVSGDGSWRKRGFQSLSGVATLIGHHTGKVIDICVKSAYCAACKLWESRRNTVEYTEWLDNHEDECQMNHEGSSDKMEVDAVREMFERSQELYGVKYKYYVGDGDSKTFHLILETQRYGEEFEVLKRECVGHVQKRMWTRLRLLKKNTKGIGGKAKLTDKLIGEVTQYYGKAIRSNSDDVEKMKTAIMATYYHKCSTDENPQHSFCPEVPDSWCSWQRAKSANNLLEYKHKPALHPDVQTAILPVYEALSETALLSKCIGGFTQNANESFNNIIWKIAPKTMFSGNEIVEIAAYIATALFNDGSMSLLKCVSNLGIEIGERAVEFCNTADEERLHDADISMESRSKESRIRKKVVLQMKADEDAAAGPSHYSPGNF